MGGEAFICCQPQCGHSSSTHLSVFICVRCVRYSYDAGRSNVAEMPSALSGLKLICVSTASHRGDSSEKKIIHQPLFFLTLFCISNDSEVNLTKELREVELWNEAKSTPCCAVREVTSVPWQLILALYHHWMKLSLWKFYQIYKEHDNALCFCISMKPVQDAFFFVSTRICKTEIWKKFLSSAWILFQMWNKNRIEKKREIIDAMF